MLTDVTSDNLVWSEEIFGPVAPIQVYDDVDEAIEIIDASEYGLSVSILTSNTYAAFELSDRIDAGAVHINDSTVDDEEVAPFGGWKGSGAAWTVRWAERQYRDLHRDAVGHAPERHRALSVLKLRRDEWHLIPGASNPVWNRCLNWSFVGSGRRSRTSGSRRTSTAVRGAVLVTSSATTTLSMVRAARRTARKA